MKHVKFFNSFLEDKVNLNKTRIDILDEKVEVIDNYLKDNLSNYRGKEIQGSYAMGTIIKPPKSKDFDADIMIYVDNKENLSPKDYIDEIYNLFKENATYTDIVSRKTRCINLNYSGDFSLDIVPCIEINNKKYICNKQEDRFEITDGTGYKEWLINQNTKSQGYLKKITRLIKYLRDIKTNFSCKSILLTTLLGNQISDSKSYKDIPTALKEIINSLNDFLQKNHKIPIIKNPVLEDEDFNRHWDEKKYSNFREKINYYNEKINEAFKNNDHNDSVKKWREIFGDNFGELQDENTYQESLIIGANKPYCE